MATVAQTISAFTKLATKIFEASSSGRFTPEESAQLSQLLVAINGAVRNFRARPAHGDSSAEYDAAIAAAKDAEDALDRATTGTLDEALAAIRAAIKALKAVTSPFAAKASKDKVKKATSSNDSSS